MPNHTQNRSIGRAAMGGPHRHWSGRASGAPSAIGEPVALSPRARTLRNCLFLLVRRGHVRKRTRGQQCARSDPSTRLGL